MSDSSSSELEGPVLAGKVVVVTGGGRGIGRAIALACAAEGAKVLVNDLGSDLAGEGADPTVADAVVAEIRGAGGTAIADAHDVSAPGAASAIVDRAVSELGRLDALISCAGIVADRSVLKTDDALLSRVLDVHVKGTFALVRAAGQVMVDRKEGGAIVLCTGPSAFFGARGQSAIGAASAAIVALTRSAALELRKHRVRVNAIAPTARTRQTEELPTFQGIHEGSMSPGHVAPLAVFLSSSLAEDVHGEVLGIAGARAYAFRARETTGSFSDGRPLSVRELRDVWRDITRA
ncbi:SDR family NAD(P)-dependent oxidoreductase [Sandaracinus amylolyticus]|uniref:SDR family NAD(P)-dependent oxidoreductase n=1 Tax=Sandaracinus amylolyticus TaxID=927083 RepID=UPI001F256069|nr:SDR family oxidoreductase [Sandaracinus amylolyticus]UJR79038.1 Short-chain dehydrogenase [Sandaracinus amylolyticus]